MNQNFHDIYIKNLRDTLDFDFHNQPRGMEEYEKLCKTIQLLNPVERVIYSRERMCNIVFHFAEFFWYMTDDNSLEMIGYYAKNMKKYSQDGKILPGTGYGKKINKKLRDGKSQIEHIVELLKRDPDSKRAVIQIFESDELCDTESIDVSCTLALQFLLRNNRLYCIAYMRANDMYIGNASDVFSFTMIQEYIARLLNVEIGTYYHIVGSSHIYKVNFKEAEKVVRTYRPFQTYNMAFPKMPQDNVYNSLQMVLHFEKEMRKNNRRYSFTDIKDCGLNSYWQDIVSLLELYREVKNNEELDVEILCNLNETFKYLFELRFVKEN